MNRFYLRAINEVEIISRELSGDIKDYVNHLAFINSLLVDELSKSDNLRSKDLLKSLGYRVNSSEIDSEPN